MPFYHRLGEVPPKRHITFFKEDGKSLFREELVSTRGFSGIYANKYHYHMPTKALAINELEPLKNVYWEDAPLMHMHFFTDDFNQDGDFLSSRVLFMQNPHVRISTGKVSKNPDFFYRNSYAHELVLIHRGTGVFKSDYGNFPFRPKDQIIVPMGTIYQLHFDDFTDNKILVVESDTPFDFPKHFINEYGQLNEDAPFSERDIKVPTELESHDEKGEFKVIHKANDRFFEYVVPYHPFDVVGWDGHLHPYAFNMEDYAPKVGKIHLPPPVHLVWTTQHFVICNFCPRLFDFHPQSIPAPYYHANVDSAEVLYYVEGDFMSRKGIKDGSITHHPMGIPHGPQPGKTEASVGVKDTFEYAFMLDTFGPLGVTHNVKEALDEDYYKSWIEDKDK